MPGAWATGSCGEQASEWRRKRRFERRSTSPSLHIAGQQKDTSCREYSGDIRSNGRLAETCCSKVAPAGSGTSYGRRAHDGEMAGSGSRGRLAASSVRDFPSGKKVSGLRKPAVECRLGGRGAFIISLRRRPSAPCGWERATSARIPVAQPYATLSSVSPPSATPLFTPASAFRCATQQLIDDAFLYHQRPPAFSFLGGPRARGIPTCVHANL